jgi:hypothetical protein
MSFLEASHSNTKVLLKLGRARTRVVHIDFLKAWKDSLRIVHIAAFKDWIGGRIYVGDFVESIMT